MCGSAASLPQYVSLFPFNFTAREITTVKQVRSRGGIYIERTVVCRALAYALEAG
jgi:hypothetical protein